MRLSAPTLTEEGSAPEQKSVPPARRSWGEWIYLAGLTGLFVWGAILRFNLPQTPLADNDTWGYLNPAVSALNGGPFLHTFSRNFLYPSGIWLLLKLTNDYRSICVVQHLLGLGGGWFLVTAVRAAGKLVTPRFWPIGIERGIGALAAAVYLLSSSVIAFEHKIRPEAVFAFAAMLSVWLGLRFIDYRYRSRHINRSIVFGATHLFLLGVLASLKPSFALTSVFAALPVLVALFGPAYSAAQRTFLWLVPALLVSIILWLPEHRLEKADPQAITAVPATLFTIHANIIREQMAMEAGDGNFGPVSPEVGRSLYELLGRELDKTMVGEHYKSLGFDPDYLMFEDSFCLEAIKRFKWNGEALARYYRYWYLHTLRARPGEFAAKALRQLQVFYRKHCPAYYIRKNYRVADLYKDAEERLARPLFQDALRQTSSGHTFLARMEQESGSTQELTQPSVILNLHEWLANTYLRILCLSLVLCTATFFVGGLRRRCGLLAAALLFIYGYGFGTNVEVALVHSLEIRRYTSIQLSFTLLPQLLSLGFFVVFILAAREAWRGRKTA